MRRVVVAVRIELLQFLFYKLSFGPLAPVREPYAWGFQWTGIILRINVDRSYLGKFFLDEYTKLIIFCRHCEIWERFMCSYGMYVGVSYTILPYKFVCEIRDDENLDISSNNSTSKFPIGTLEYSPTCNYSYPIL